MGGLVKGDIVVVPYPFSDLTQTKRRPALVVASAGGDDLILCQMTSRHKQDRYALLLDPVNLKIGSLNQQGYIRPNRLFTADKQIILYRIGSLKDDVMRAVTDAIVKVLRAP
jgi:mRNA interferase MazF